MLWRSTAPKHRESVFLPMRQLERPGAKLRIWAGEQSPDGQVLPPNAVVGEWAGQVGHPTSYALLGVVPVPSGVTFSMPIRTARFEESLAGSSDEVSFGQPAERERQFIDDVLGSDGSGGWSVLVAACAPFGSSPMAFRWMASFLRSIAYLDIANLSDEGLWIQWDEVRLPSSQ